MRPHESRINRLMLAVVQEKDVENAVRALVKHGFGLTRLPSAGGFLGRRNTTLLIGLQSGQEALAVQILGETCRRRVEYVSAPLESTNLPLPAPVPVTVGGATVFTFEVERYEEL